MIEKFYTTTFEVNRAEWKTDESLNQYSELVTIGTFLGHLQQASAVLAQNLGLNMTKTFTIWTYLTTDIIEGDTLEKLSGDPTLINEIQKILVTHETARSGYWTVTFGGNTTAHIPWNASEGDIEQILETVIGEGHVEVTGSMITKTILIEFTHGQSGIDQPLLVIDNQVSHENIYNPENLIEYTIEEIQKGGMTYDTDVYSVRAIQKNDTGANPHLEIVVEYDQDNSVNT